MDEERIRFRIKQALFTALLDVEPLNTLPAAWYEAKASALWAEAKAALREQGADLPVWDTIDKAPRDQMFIWAAPGDGGTWRLGLAYWTVTGAWSDAYGAPAKDATLFITLPPPP